MVYPPMSLRVRWHLILEADIQAGRQEGSRVSQAAGVLLFLAIQHFMSVCLSVCLPARYLSANN